MAFLKRRWDWVVYAAIVLLAFGLRFGNLVNYPFSLWVDEAWFGLRGREVLTGVNLMPLQPPGLGVGDSAFQIYAAALVQALGFPVAFSSRLASAALGLLSVIVLYPTLLTLFENLLPEVERRVAALTGCLVLSTLLPALIHSRWGGQMNGSLLATILTALGAYQTYARQSWRWAIFTGVVVGVGQTTYEAALALPLIVVVFWVVRLALAGAAERSRLLLLGGLIGLATFVSYAPMLVFYYFHPGIHLAHVADTQVVTWGEAWYAPLVNALIGLRNVWLGLSIRGDSLPGRNLVGRPLFDGFASVLLWAGLLWGVRFARRQPAFQLLLVWMGVASVPSALSTESPAFTRMLPMMPALAAGVGLGGVQIWKFIARRQRRAGLWAGAGLGLGVLVSGALNIQIYFGPWSQQPGLFDAIFMGSRLVAETALAQAHTDEVWVTTHSNLFVRDPFQLLFEGTSIHTFDASTCLPYANHLSRPVSYGIIPIMDPHSLSLLKQDYPAGAELPAIMHPKGDAFAIFYRVPADTPAPQPQLPISVVYGDNLHLLGLDAPSEAASGETITLRLYWEVTQPLATDVTSFVHLGRGDASDPLLAQNDGLLCPGWPTSRWITGYVQIETRTLTLALDAPPGEYDLRVGTYIFGSSRITISTANVLTENNRAIVAPLRIP